MKTKRSRTLILCIVVILLSQMVSGLRVYVFAEPISCDPNSLDYSLIDELEVVVGQALDCSFNYGGGDPNTLTIWAEGIPDGMEILQAPWRLNWTPDANQEGEHCVNFFLQDEPPGQEIRSVGGTARFIVYPYYEPPKWEPFRCGGE